ncbi:conserved hypothetical protein [Ruegeria lacuscaerulensis ITI-1157]|nr:conserved hypothetical protein [Ruegeria lacuscaerulensis ITI-1157]SHI64539.1 hypothetical protein SAMN05444404_0702 [Ruegeria lacuscaerulensis ITI-1157]
MTSIILAIVIGAAFGVALDRVGASNPSTINKMLNLTDLRLAKAIMLAIGLGSVLMFGGQMIGLVDVGHMSVKAAYAGVFVGGLLLGAGWAMAGYCPGTGLVAAASGRKDALFFVAGGLLGAAAYMMTYPMWRASGLLDPIWGGKVTLGVIPGSGYDGVTSLPGDILGIVLGLAFIAIAFALPERLLGQPSTQAHPAE